VEVSFIALAGARALSVVGWLRLRRVVESRALDAGDEVHFDRAFDPAMRCILIRRRAAF
jgi:hypothetical protein